jgi:hypothetical protein
MFYEEMHFSDESFEWNQLFIHEKTKNNDSSWHVVGWSEETQRELGDRMLSTQSIDANNAINQSNIYIFFG